MCNAGHDAMNAMRANAIAERRRSRHAAHSESAEIGVAGRALVLSLRDSNRQRMISSGGERDEDARTAFQVGEKEQRRGRPRLRGFVAILALPLFFVKRGGAIFGSSPEFHI